MDHAAPLNAASRLRRLAAPLFPLSCLQDVKLTHTAKLVLVMLAALRPFISDCWCWNLLHACMHRCVAGRHRTGHAAGAHQA